MKKFCKDLRTHATKITNYCMKKFCKDLKTHATKITNYEKKKMIPLTIKEEIYPNKQKFVTYAKKNLINMIKNNKK